MDRPATKRKPAAWSGGLLPALLCAGAAAMAQPQPAQTSRDALEEVTVTARKRDESLMRIPIAVTAFTQADIEARFLYDIADLADFAPNVEFDFTAPVSGSTNAAAVFIRGVGQSDYVPSKDPGVGIYVDGVYVTRSVGSVLNLLDVQRVEVLRGPQGTLFGKNTVGGAIDVVMVEPGPEHAGEADLTLGSDERTDFRGFVSVPLSDALYVRASLGVFRQQGYLHRIKVGDDMGDNHEEAARLAFKWLPGADFTAKFSVDYSHADERSTAAKLVSTDIHAPNSPYSIGDPQTLFAGQAYNALIGGNPPCVPTLFGCLPSLPANTLPYDRRWITDSGFTTLATGPNYSKHSVLGLNLTLLWRQWGLDFKAITGYRDTDAQFGRDADASPLVIAESEIWAEYEQFSQEIQAVGSAPGERLHWVGGIFFLTETGKQRDYVPFADETFRSYALRGIPISNFLLANGPYSVNSIDSFALYGEISYQLSPRWELTAGLRWTREERETIANTTQGGVPAVAEPRASLDFGETTGRAIASFHPTDSQLLYSSYSQGFKSGGFNHRLGIPPPPYKPLQTPTQFAPEYVDTVELGYKVSLWEGRVQLGAAWFHSRYEDQQVVAPDLGAPRTINAAESRIDGLEVEIGWAATHRWQYRLAYGFLDARYTHLDENIPGAFGNTLERLPLTLDSLFVNSPRHSLALGADAQYDLPGGSVLRLHADARFRSEVANDAINTPELIQGDLWLFDANVAWLPVQCRCEIALFGKNLSDETYIVTGAGGSRSLGSAELILARPREWGLRVSYRFR